MLSSMIAAKSRNRSFLAPFGRISSTVCSYIYTRFYLFFMSLLMFVFWYIFFNLSDPTIKNWEKYVRDKNRCMDHSCNVMLVLVTFCFVFTIVFVNCFLLLDCGYVLLFVLFSLLLIEYDERWTEKEFPKYSCSHLCEGG